MLRPTLIACAIGLPLVVSGCAEWSRATQAAGASTGSPPAAATQVAAQMPPSSDLLERDRRIVETNNVLAVLQAKQGQYQDAEQLLLASIAQAPHAAYLYNNLGYVYLLDGQLERAKATFEQAAHIAPDDAHVRANLAKVAERMTAHAVVAAPNPAPQVAPSAPSVVTATDTLTIMTPSTGTLVVAQVAPNVYEIRDPGQTVAAPSVPTAVAKVPLAQELESLDVVNGNGVTGMARRVATELHTLANLPMARLFNQIPYDQRTTLIQYRDGMLEAATRLQSQLPGHSEIVPMHGATTAPADIRILLGHDAVSWPVAWSGRRATRFVDSANTSSPNMALKGNSKSTKDS